MFGASANAFDTKFTGFSFCHPNYCDCLLHALVRHALQSASCAQEATAPFLLLPVWLGWSKNGYTSWIHNHPGHACVLAIFSANSMLLNPTKEWLDPPPPQPQHYKNKIGTKRQYWICYRQCLMHLSFSLTNSYWTQWLYSTICTGKYSRAL